jgi:hypothetical protein
MRRHDPDVGSTLKGIAAVGAVALVGVGGYLVYKYFAKGGAPGGPGGLGGPAAALYQSGYSTGIAFQNWLRSLLGQAPLVPVGEITTQQKQAQSLVMQPPNVLSPAQQAQYQALVQQGYANAAGGTSVSPYGGGFYLPQAGTLSPSQLQSFQQAQAALTQQLQSGAITPQQYAAQMTVLNNQYVALSAVG